jgi:hypothetical protein
MAWIRTILEAEVAPPACHPAARVRQNERMNELTNQQANDQKKNVRAGENGRTFLVFFIL